MNIEILLNEALNKAMCTNDRIKNPNSNKIAAFVTEFMASKELKSDCVLDNVIECTYLINFLNEDGYKFSQSIEAPNEIAAKIIFIKTHPQTDTLIDCSEVSFR